MKMSKRKMAVILLIFSFLLMAGCAQRAQERPESETTENEVVFVDALGREIKVSSPEKVAVLIGSFADIWCLAGGRDSLVATANDAWTQFNLQLDEDVVNLGMTKEINTELLLAADPDFVIASSNTAADVELLSLLESAGINVAYFKVSTFEDYLHMLDICTDITGQKENYEIYGEDIRRQVESAVGMADGSKPTVLYVRASGSSCKIKNSNNSVLGEMLRDLDCVNIADSEEELLENLNMETVLVEDPEYIFLVMQGTDSEKIEEVLRTTLLDQPAWESLTAVQEGRCYILDQRLYNLKPNAQWGDAYEQLAEILYGNK